MAGRRLRPQWRPTEMRCLSLREDSALPAFGIGIITRNRLTVLRQTVAAIKRFTAGTHTLVIADDGSEDGTVVWSRRQGIPVVTGPRRGCAWNKNRALYYLMTCVSCDPLFLLEDDTRPITLNWQNEWIAAAHRWQHVNYCYGFDRANPPPGSGTFDDPFLCPAFGGHCTVTTRDALNKVGFLDPRFQGYGWEHVEWSWRFRHYYGNCWGIGERLLPCLDIGVAASWPPSHFNQREMDANALVYAQIRSAIIGPYRCDPWHNDSEQAALVEEIMRARRAARNWRSLFRWSCPWSWC